MARQASIPAGIVGVCIFPLVGLALASWVVALAGVSSLQQLSVSSRQSWEFDWWIVMLNLVAFILVAVYTALGPHRSNTGVVALLAVVTTLNMIRCDVYNTLRLEINAAATPASTASSAVTGRKLLSTSPQKRVNTLFSGYLLMSFFSILLMLVQGHFSTQHTHAEYGAKNVNAEARGLSTSQSGVPTGAASTTTYTTSPAV